MSNQQYVLNLLEQTLMGVRFYSPAVYTRQLYENTGLDTSEMPPGTYLAAVKNHKLSGNSIILLFGSPRKDAYFDYRGNEIWNRMTVQPTNHDAVAVLSNKTLQFTPALKQVQCEFVNVERGVQEYHITNAGMRMFTKVRGITHSGFLTDLYGLLHFSDQFVLTRDIGAPTNTFNYGNTQYTLYNYPGGIVRDPWYQYSSDYSRGILPQ